MQFINIKHIARLVVLLGAVAGFAPGSNAYAQAEFHAPQAEEKFRTPSLPSGCESLRVPAGNKVSSRVFAIGVQIYRWNGASWDFVAPLANLYADQDFYWQVGVHYAGPTWEDDDSKVVARRAAGCDPDSTAISWLLLEKVSSEGSGIFGKVTFIQRVNTAGGLRPTTPGSFIGEEKRVPYSTEYFFYRGNK